MLPRTKLGVTRMVLTGLSAREFAEQLTAAGLPVSLRRLRAIELGEVKPSRAEVEAIATLLGVPTFEVPV